MIGLNCNTGEFSDCEESFNEPSESIPLGCDGALFFSDNDYTCGSLCFSNRKKRSTRKEGWTKFFSADTPSGTGDHEHYLYFYGDTTRDRLKVYDTDGMVYTHCEKTAIHVRERETGDPWWKLRKDYTLLFSENTKKFGSLEGKSKYFYRLRPDSG